ncbi:MAG: glucose-6-phosphate isomerase [Gammaproteobacteria bacterium]|nr:MAG: glucose-6-phosphate isomerase [Gammaproteobacteria bacterium]
MDHDFLQLLQKYNIDSGQKLLSERCCEPDRFRDFSKTAGNLLLDFSRTGLNQQALAELLQLAANSGVEESRERLFQGVAVNFTEQRPALHMAMRSDDVLNKLDTETMARVVENRKRMLGFASAFAAGHLPGATRQPVQHIIHIGIGGSVLGPRLLIEALGKSSSPQVHFLSSGDAYFRSRLLADLNPAETVVIVASKSFTTGETLLHARRVMQWMKQELGRDAAVQRLFAISGNMAAVEEFGTPQANTLYLPDWVGGRYSLWSAVSLAAAAVMGEGAFTQFLQGAADMDRHFQTAAMADNLPVLLALTGIWHRNICAYPAQAVIPYDQRLRSLPAYLQQLVMESGGKSVDREGKPVNCNTSPVLFGEPGTDAQHSLFQMFHQGTDIVPLNFIGVIRPDHDDTEAHAILLANMLAQATALATGTAGLQNPGELDAHRQTPGGRPSEIILLDELTPSSLGQLLALYEHKVFVESVIWGINPFDQFGVELGKVLAENILPALQGKPDEIPESYGLNAILNYIHSKK